MKKKKTIIIISLFIMLCLMGIGFALLRKNLRLQGLAGIDGNWDVKITEIVPVSYGDARYVLNKDGINDINNTGTVANFNVSLNKPGDYVEYTVKVSNNGNIDATLNEIVTSTQLNNSVNGIIYSISGISEGERLLRDSEKLFTVRITFDSSVTNMPNILTGNFTLELLYLQCSNCGVPSPNTVTLQECFTVDSNGLITSYDYSCGKDVIVPAVVDGKQVKKIDSKSFLSADYNAVVYFDKSDEFHGIIIEDVANAEAISDAIDTMSGGWISTQHVPIAGIDGVYKENVDSVSTITSSLEIAYLVYLNVDYINNTEADEIHSDIETLNLTNAIYLEEIGMSSFMGENSDGDACSSVNSEFVFSIDGNQICALGSLTNVVFGSLTNLKKIGSAAFKSNKLTSIDLSNLVSINSIDFQAFTLNRINNVIFPINSGYTIINKLSFAFNHIETLIIPSSITVIGEGVFLNNRISSLTLNNGLVIINSSAFAMNSLTNVSIPSTVTTISDNVFTNNPNLGTIMVDRSQIGMTLGHNWQGTGTPVYSE